MSAIAGKPDNICSTRTLPLLTHLYGPAVQCKRFSSTWVDAVLHYCIRPLIGASAPGHHGYQRAYDLILGKASNGLVGSPVFARARKTDHAIVVSSSRRPRRVILAKQDRAMTFLLHVVPLFVPSGRFFVPARDCVSAPRARAVKAGRREDVAACAGVSRLRLDGPEHGARIKQIETLLHRS